MFEGKFSILNGKHPPTIYSPFQSPQYICSCSCDNEVRVLSANIFFSKRGFRLYGEIVIDSLTEHAYDANLAGLSYELKSHYCGLSIQMKGYNDKMFVLAQHILNKIKGLVVDPRRLFVIKEKVTFPFKLFHFSVS